MNIDKSVYFYRSGCYNISAEEIKRILHLIQKGADTMKITVIGRKCSPRDSFKERAEKRLNSKDENIDIKRAEIALQRAVNRLTLK